MKQQVLAALSPRFSSAVTANIVFEPTTDRYNGYVLSEDFAGLSFLERQKRVFDVLRAEIESDVQLISMLFTYTPDEYAVLQAS